MTSFPINHTHVNQKQLYQQQNAFMNFTIDLDADESSYLEIKNMQIETRMGSVIYHYLCLISIFALIFLLVYVFCRCFNSLPNVQVIAILFLFLILYLVLHKILIIKKL